MRYDVMHARSVEGRDKPFWQKCGVAFEKDGKISIKLDYVPVAIDPKEGLWLKLFEPRQKDEAF